MFGTSNAKRLVLSFYVKSSKTGTYSVGFHNNGFDRNLVSEYTISSANTWEKKTITFVGDTSGTWTTDTSIGMGVYFHLSNGDGSNTTSTLDSWQSGNNYLGSQSQVNLWDSSSATWFITGIQLEIGQNPTEFQHEPFETTLRKCQRYYAHTYGYGNTVGASFNQSYNGMIYLIGTGNYGMSVEWKFPVEMRATPTVDLYGNAGTKNRVTYWNGSESTYDDLNRTSSQLTGFSLGATANTEDFYSAGCVAQAEL